MRSSITSIYQFDVQLPRQLELELSSHIHLFTFPQTIWIPLTLNIDLQHRRRCSISLWVSYLSTTPNIRLSGTGHPCPSCVHSSCSSSPSPRSVHVHSIPASTCDSSRELPPSHRPAILGTTSQHNKLA